MPPWPGFGKTGLPLSRPLDNKRWKLLLFLYLAVLPYAEKNTAPCPCDWRDGQAENRLIQRSLLSCMARMTMLHVFLGLDDR